MAAQLVAIDGGWRVEGDINYHTVVGLKQEGERNMANTSGTCKFDFSTVDQVNTSALALLLSWHRKAKALGVDLQYVDVPPELLAIAEMSDLGSLFN